MWHDAQKKTPDRAGEHVLGGGTLALSGARRRLAPSVTACASRSSSGLGFQRVG
jgi:hypothetical protein